MPRNACQTKILGIDFFRGTPRQVVERLRSGGLLVVPAAPALKDLETNAAYREALVNADVVLPDSGYMVLLWNFLEGDSLRRLSGLEYLRELVQDEDFRRPGTCLWVMSSEASSDIHASWLAGKGIQAAGNAIYIAPMYERQRDGGVADAELLALIEKLRPKNVVITLGGGVQEQLGFYLSRNLSYRPAIHCIGAALAFLSGDQVRIPRWADRMYLGWLFRSVSNPRVFFPRYWEARKLFHMMLRDRERLPARLEPSPDVEAPGFGRR